MVAMLPGVDAGALLKALDTPPSVAVRLNRRKPLGDGELYPEMTPVEWCADGRRLSQRPLFTANPLLHAGAFYVQDPSSMIYQQIAALIASESGGRPLDVLDFCAAPGGKTTAMINGLPDGSRLVANEYDPRRGMILRENLEKWGYPSVITTGDSSSAYARLGSVFDLVAVDAPCSGEGMMRREPEARSQWSRRLTEDCARLQRSILDDVAGCVRPGGYLVYSTCTFNTDENEANAAYIRDELGFLPVRLPLAGVESASREIAGDVAALRFMPYLTDGEGLFVSVFRRPEDAEARRAAAGRGKRRRERGASGRGDKGNAVSVEPVATWLRDGAEIFAGEEIATALPGDMLPILSLLEEAGVNVTGAGLPVARLKGREFVPDSRVALSMLANPKAFPVVSLTETDAVSYLRGEALPLPADTPRGYVAVAFRGHPLGLMKNLGNRANNLYPQFWRIRTRL